MKKRQRAAALHDLSNVRTRFVPRKASWSAAVPDRKVLCRFSRSKFQCCGNLMYSR